MKKKPEENPVCQMCTFHKNHPGMCYVDLPVFMGRKQPSCEYFKRKKGGK